MNASAESTLRSRSLLSRRHLPSHANVRSTVHRRGNFTQPSDPLGRLTMTSSQRVLVHPTVEGVVVVLAVRKHSLHPAHRLTVQPGEDLGRRLGVVHIGGRH